MPAAKVKACGSKVEVWHGAAKHTAGGLKKGDLMQNARGKIVSIKKHEAGLRTGKANLGDYLQGKVRVDPRKALVPRRTTRVRKQVGKGIGSDLGGVVDGIGHLFGLGLPDAPAYSSVGGHLHRRKQPKALTGKGIGSDIGGVVDGIGSLFGLGLPKRKRAVRR